MDFAPSFYGISMVPKEYWKIYGHALLTIAGSDGDVSNPEMEWLILKLGKAMNVDKATLADWESFAYEDADLADIFAQLDSVSIVSYNKLLIYDAIRMACADDEYADEERELVAEAAALLRVDRESLMAIESLIEMERATDRLRSIILC